MNNNMPVINISKNIKDNPLEVWVKIKNYPKYEVSNLGRIISYNNKNPRLIGDEHHIGDDFEFVIYKVQIKVLWFWVTIKEFDEDEYYDAVDCFRYCTNPYIN